MRWLVQIAVTGAELIFMWLIVVVCVIGSVYSIYLLVTR